MIRRDCGNKMADSDEWFVVEDGCLSVGKTVNSVTYHSTLNTILVTTKEPSLQVIDVASGLLLQNSDLSAQSSQLDCVYLPSKEQVLVSDGFSVGVRRDYHGILLLDTALQTPVKATEDNVRIELALAEASHLFQCLMSADLPGVDYVEDVLRELEKEIEVIQQATKANHKVAKWATVCISQPHCALKTVCSSLVLELKRLHQHAPGLPVASAVADRLSYLLPPSHPDNVAVDRALMYSEGARRQTFSKWPHMNYKWALPEAMAQAGFYHQPSSTGYDRAMCFTCNVCLVCWEPTDEPWSEHERHSPTCPFVKGEYTQNVPIVVTYATQPAQLHSSKGNLEKIECISSTSSEDFIATSTLHGSICVWNISSQLKKQVHFHVDPWEPLIALKTGLQQLPTADAGPPGVREAWPEPPTAPEEDEKDDSQTTMDSSEDSEPKLSDDTESPLEEYPSCAIEESSMSKCAETDDSKSKMEDTVGQGAWKYAIKEEQELPLSETSLKTESVGRCRPSQDVLVSSLCVAGAQSESKGGAAAVDVCCQPALLIGAAIRSSMAGLTESKPVDSGSEVQALNQVNQALSGDAAPKIIEGASNANGSLRTNPFLPYILVYDIGGLRPISKVKPAISTDKPAGTSSSSSGTKVSSLVSTVQDYYMPQIMELDEEGYMPFNQAGPLVQAVPIPPPMPDLLGDDDGDEDMPMDLDVQIVGVQGPAAKVSSSGWQPNMLPPLKAAPVQKLHKNKEHASSRRKKEGGRLLQVLSLPASVPSDHYISHIQPCLNSNHVVVVTAPRCQAQGEGMAECSEGVSAATGGYLLVYRVRSEQTVALLQETPAIVRPLASSADTITSLLMLPCDMATLTEEEDVRTSTQQPMATNEEGVQVDGQVAVTTISGHVNILRLSDFKCLATISPPEEEKFVSVTYCTGMDRLCASSESGKLHFFAIYPKKTACQESEDAPDGSPAKSSTGSLREDAMEPSAAEHLPKPETLLAQQPLTTEVLTKLHELTEFECLMPRFTATVPPCWSEIQQEQQQRRHPQHLQQQGEATQHTRTWRLQNDSTSWDEHLFELVLCKPCTVGHIDFKFTLHPLCTSAPAVQVTLLKQNISSLGRITPGHGNSEQNTDGTSGQEAGRAVEPDFMKRYGAEVLCGPVELEDYVDLSGHSGVVTLTSAQLLQSKARAYLVHVKAVHSHKDNSPKEPRSQSAPSASSSSSTPDSNKDKASALKAIWEPYGTAGTATERLSSSATKQKLENLRGCDWLQEVSVTIRRCRKTSVPLVRDRTERLAIVESRSLHEQLLVLACGQDEAGASSQPHRQGLALDLLCWVASLQLHQPNCNVVSESVMWMVQANLKALARACFIEAGRSIAHKAARLITLCTEYSKKVEAVCSMPAFNISLLQALLANLPLISCAYSAGALRWFFTLLNRVKVLDVGLTGDMCAELLTQVAKHYHERTNPLHSLLKARYGLYGAPLDPLLFDIEPPSSNKPGGQSSNSSYASTVTVGNHNYPAFSGTGGFGTSTTTSSTSASIPGSGSSTQPAQPQVEEVDFNDLMSLTSGDKWSSRAQATSLHRYVWGLLEVEPLHFTCHATSDGTRMERMDAGSGNASNTGSFGLSGQLHFGEGVGVPSSAGAALASLSTAMASAEQQLLVLQQKQAQLAKLEQKLVASGKLAAGTSPGNSPYMASSAAGSAQSTPPLLTLHGQDSLLPPTPKTTPLFMTPPVTPPNESLLAPFPHNSDAPDPGKPPPWKPGNNGKANGKGMKGGMAVSAAPHLLQCPPAQVLVIERMHSGARRFVVLDFGRPILLTDILIPACNDLASLSIDTWVQGEEVDGQRLLVATDIGMRSLVMNDLMPAPVCRYLKITTIGRYGGSTTRSRIPIGSFYGHTAGLGWESSGGSLDSASLMTHLGTLLALQEDIQCRYSLACSRLESLLAGLEAPNSSTAHTRYYLRRLKRSTQDTAIHTAYSDCMALQLQLNLAMHARERLQRALGLPCHQVPATTATPALLQQASTDKLRVLAELLVDCLLSMTVASASVARLPGCLQAAFPPLTASALFRHLCVESPRRLQLSAGLLLTRLCGTQTWWGSFLGGVLQDYFSANNQQVFPQDRVFILLTVLGQKCLSGPRPNGMLESVLALLAKLLQPLQQPGTHAGQLDLCLIGWVLLFLSRNLDATGQTVPEDLDKGASAKDKDSNSSRWEFLQSDGNVWSERGGSKASLSKLYRRKLHKRLLHHKHQLQDLQTAKKNFMAAQMEKSNAVALVMKDAELILKQQEAMFKKELKQYSSKHIKDIMQIRRTDGEIIKKLPKDSPAGGERENAVLETDAMVMVSAEKCLPVVRGLVNLLLAMDFTCNVDLFLIACKVVARLSHLSRPAVCLHEALSQADLERMLLLCCHLDYNHGNLSWGGAWAGHAITCLLQDLLDAEKLNGSLMQEALTDDHMAAALAQEQNTVLPEAAASSTQDNSPQASSPLPTMEELTPGAEAEAASEKPASSLLMDMLLEAEEGDDEGTLKLQDYIQDLQAFKGHPPPAYSNTAKGQLGPQYSFDTYLMNKNKPGSVLSHQAFGGAFSLGGPHLSSVFGGNEDKQKKFETWKNKQIVTYFGDKGLLTPQGVSTAMDSRLENSIELSVELRLKVMVSLEAESIQTSFSAPLPVIPIVPTKLGTDHQQQPETISVTNVPTGSPVVQSSSAMLSSVFNSLFSGLQAQRVNLESVLLMWLTLNEDTLSDEGGGQANFDPGRVPSIPVGTTAVQGQLQALAWAPCVSVQTWVLAFQSLTLLANSKCPTTETSLASVMLADPNLTTVLIKFLSATSSAGPSISNLQPAQIGPTATRAFHDFLVRMQLRVADGGDSQLKEMLLRLLYILATDKGAFHCGLGPLDAQCKMVDFMLEQNYESVDVNNALSVIECVCALAHQQLASPDKVVCPINSEAAVSSRSCFAGLFSSVLRGNDSNVGNGEASRDSLLVSLLQLVELLVQVRPPGAGRQRAPATPNRRDQAPLTDAAKVSQCRTAPRSPEPVSETDEQKTESGHTSQPRSCSHFTDLREADWSQKEQRVADLVLSHRGVMRHLVEALSCCNSNTMAMILGSSGLPGTLQDSMAGNSPLSVGDAVFYVLCTINRLATDIHLLLQPLLDYLTCEGRALCIAHLSEPLLWYILRVLDCPLTISAFRQLGGVEVICHNLVESNQRVINMSPSLVSTLMQYLGNGRMGSLLHKKGGVDTDSTEDWQNFAPLGLISSSSPTAGPAEVLLQASPPHRRARSAAWSYHFYPDEAWVDLTISLPCAVLLREVRIQPHLTSLATCPSAVSVEVSRDGMATVPLCAPQPTSGLPLIKLQLLKAEVVSAVTLRLHKPRCLATIGLSQIMLLGNTAFREVHLGPSSMFQPTEDYVSRTSIGWLRLLHHCLTASESSSSAVAAAAAPIPGLLATCTALLGLTSVQLLYATNLEAVLLRLGLHSLPMGLALIQHILSCPTDNASPAQLAQALPLHGKVYGLANDSTVDILYQLGTAQDAGTQSRLSALLGWLQVCARECLQERRTDAHQTTQQPAPAHVHCIAAILWHSQELPVTYDLQATVSRDLLGLLYDWSLVLAPQSALKCAVDAVLCSVCYVQPAHLDWVLSWVGIAAGLASNTHLSSLTDDLKDGRPLYSSEPLTDDSKEASAASLQAELRPLKLDAAHLQLLAAVCQSSEGLRRLLQTGFLTLLAQALHQYCRTELVCHCEPATAAESSASSSDTPGQQDCSLVLSASMVGPVLSLLAGLAQEAIMKDWLGSAEGSIFWPGLLSLLCHTLTQATGPQQLHPTATKIMSSQQRSAIETATVTFFTNVISCHTDNQQLFASVLCDVIRSQTSGTNSFARRLFLQVLLEDERVLVCFSSSSSLYKSSTSAMAQHSWHPRCGAGHKARAASIGLHCTTAEVLTKISDVPNFKAPVMDGDLSDEHKSSEKDVGQLGLEVVDQISAAAGLQAKEKRDKSKMSSPRPPTRRGHRPPEGNSAGSVCVPFLQLYHKLLPGQPLPSNMTLSQLLTLLQERGFRRGQSTLELQVKHNTKKLICERSESRLSDEASSSTTPIPDAVLLETAPFPSALQVFASMGGLALLAEHLPLLYPEVTRQVTPPPASEGNLAGSSASDWVTVESTEDIYEDIYELPASHLNHASKSAGSLVPSIPPHSLVAFGLFLRLPGYAEVLLKERRKAQCLLRLVLGVTDDGEGGYILTLPVASSLPTLPFHVLKTLFDGTPLRTDDGVLLRRMTLEIGVVHLVLACLSVLSHHAPRVPIPGFHQEIIMAATQAAVSLSVPVSVAPAKPVEDKSQTYWAKGTGFGTGSTTSSWDAEHALQRQKSEEEHVTCLLQVLSSYLNPGGAMPDGYERDSYPEDGAECKQNLPVVLPELLSHSCLVPAISSYLRNDSVLDMARHVPLYRALLELLRALAACPSLVALLLPLDREEDAGAGVGSLLEKMKACVDTYANRLKSNKGKGGSKSKQEEEESEGLALLIPDIQETARLVHIATSRCRQRSAHLEDQEGSAFSDAQPLVQNDHSHEQRYIEFIRELQFDTYEMVVDEEAGVKFMMPHHYESSVKAAGDTNNPSRARRLAQEAVTLSTSLPLSYSSSVFVRCDEDRLDVMKVLITGPCDTPYANGCFEFDVYFPQDYPNSPPLINLETTGNHTVRFNPNLYNDGKVCLSILNTWHGRPEEKWNSQTSSFLQVLVSIQSLILVSEPYFNEPGYERSRGTPSGNASSREYDANIRQATVKWAMLEQLRNPCPCFKEVIRHHFYLKRHEVCKQVEGWIAEMEAYSTNKRMGRTITQSCVAIKRHYNQLKEELSRLRPPEGMEDVGSDDDAWQGASGCSSTAAAATSPENAPDSKLPDLDVSSGEDSPSEPKESSLFGAKLGLAGGMDYQDKTAGGLLECMGNGEIESDEDYQSVEC